MYHLEELWSNDLSEKIIQGDTESLEKEIDKGWNVNEPLSKYFLNGIVKFPIMLAIQYNNMNSVKFLIQKGAKLDIDNEHAILYGIEFAGQEVIELLVKSKAKTNHKKIASRAYIILCKRGRFELIPLLNRIGMSLNPYGNSALLSAIANYRYDVIEKLIEYGIDLNLSVKTEYNDLGDPSLSHAAVCCDEKMIEYLFEKGANPWATNRKGQRAYHLAMEVEKEQIAKLLLQYESVTEPEVIISEKEIPKDYLMRTKNNGLEIGTKDYGVIRFLEPSNICAYYIGKEKELLLSCGIQNYPDIKILWSNKASTVAYYDCEQKEYGEFHTSFSQFVCDIDKYIHGIFTHEYFISLPELD